MKTLGFMLVLVLGGTGYWLWQDAKQSGAQAALADGGDNGSSGASADLIAAKQARAGSADASDDKGAGASKVKPDTTGAAAKVEVEGPMTAAQREEVEEHWNELCNAAMTQEQWLGLSRQYQEAFGDMPEPDHDPAHMLTAFRGVLGSRIGMNDPKAPASRVHGGLAFANHAMLNLGTAVREGHVKFRMTLGGESDGKDGLLPTKKHTQKMLYYKWRTGGRIIELSVDRISTVTEVLDMFDPERFQG